MALTVGNYIGSYRLLNLIMTGQSSQVWESMHDGQQQRFALKTLLPDYRNDREHIGYIKNEYAVGRTLEHPRVIRIHELLPYRGELFLVLEFYPVPNLKALILREFDRVAQQADQIIAQAAEGLAFFHSRGWIHRDIKPDNFLVSPEAEVKLIDFALAQKKKGGLSRLFAGKTKVIGTRSYMSPEQIRGLPLDLRADIYSFGCMLHEMIHGKPPFTGVNTQDLLTKHLRAVPPALEGGNKNVTSEFSGLVKRMLAKDPANRPESMDNVVRELRATRVFKEPPTAAAR